MDKSETIALIEAAGGNRAFAELLGLADKPGFQQRVTNWKARGIPARIVLEHQVVLEALRRKAKTVP